MKNPVIEQLFSEPTTREAREWLRGSRCYLSGFFKEESPSIVEAAYAAGAIRVYAVSIQRDRDTGNESTKTLVLELPADAEARRKVFAWAATAAKVQEGCGEADNGQTHLLVVVTRPQAP